MYRFSRLFLVVCVLPAVAGATGDIPVKGKAPMVLASRGRAQADVYVQGNASGPRGFAADELCRYLGKISGASFRVRLGRGPAGAIVLGVDAGLAEEAYTIRAKKGRLVLSGGSDRALLYAVYDLLARLGCVWLAPQFSFYDGASEYIPGRPELVYDSSQIIDEQPLFRYRKLDIEEGRSHTVENLKQMIAWMPKVRLNTFMVPLNYQGAGRVMWDNWRAALVPELKKRGLLIEVGGHGYQNFLNAGMQGGQLFKDHPDWFGRNKAGEPDAAMNLVFNTANGEAVDYLVSNVKNYILQHPEIDIFDFWPPDVARWAETASARALGSAADRQARLVNSLNRALKSIRPGLKLEIIAYGQVLEPPEEASVDPDVLVDVCPINQSFEQPLFRSEHVNNQTYAKTIRNWRRAFTGDLGLYSYYRKYAWRSLPVLLPHYMQEELKAYAALPLQGISTYAEPGDWFTYELNHYVLAALAWDTGAAVDSLTGLFCAVRYGGAADVARETYQLLAAVVPHYSSIPFTSVKSFNELEHAGRLLKEQVQKLEAAKAGQDKVVQANLSKLSLMLDYAAADMGILEKIVAGAGAGERERAVVQLDELLSQHAGAGVFVVSADQLKRLQQHYAARAKEVSQSENRIE